MVQLDFHTYAAADSSLYNTIHLNYFKSNFKVRNKNYTFRQLTTCDKVISTLLGSRVKSHHIGKEHMKVRGIYNEATMLILRIHIVIADLILVGNVVISLLQLAGKTGAWLTPWWLGIRDRLLQAWGMTLPL